MNGLAKALSGFAMIVAVGGAGPALAEELPRGVGGANTMRVAAHTPLPMRYFCAQNPGECRADGSGEIAATRDLLALLNQVNGRVNRAIRPGREKTDIWSINPARGDCEDYALSKRSALIGQGVAAGALRLAVTKTRRGEPHAVLIVRTDEGDLVLDNLSNTIKTLQATRYHIISMSSPNPMRWIAG